jgi:hypothetical protein
MNYVTKLQETYYFFLDYFCRKFLAIERKRTPYHRGFLKENGQNFDNIFNSDAALFCAGCLMLTTFSRLRSDCSILFEITRALS